MQNFRLGQGGASTAKAGMDTSTSEAPPDSLHRRSSAEEAKVGGEVRGAKTNGKTGDNHTPRKGLKIKSRDATLDGVGVPYYANTMGTAALLNSLPGRASMRDPFVWEP